MTSRFTLLAGVASLAIAGCSAPADDNGPPDFPPPLASDPNAGQGTTTPAPAAPVAAPVAQQPAAAPVAQQPAAAPASTPVATAPAAGPAAPAAIPIGMGTQIIHDSTGWVAGGTNAVGIQGSFYPYGDYSPTPPGTTTVTLDPFEATSGTVCLSGVASAVIGGAYGQYYGGGVGLNLADRGAMMGPGPWTQGSVKGFSFTITGPMIPPNLRFNASVPGATNPYCMDSIPTAGSTTIQLNSLLEACFNGATAGGPLPPTTALEAIQWQVVTVVDATTPFDFCIENLTAITTP